jgi:hypothetical protein
MNPVIDFGNGLTLDLSAEPWASQGCRWAIAANSGGGKSHLSVVALEELHNLGLPFLVIDPKIGEYRALAQLPGVIVAGQAGHIGVNWESPWMDRVIDYLMKGAGVVVNLGGMFISDQRNLYTQLLTQLWRRQEALPDGQRQPIFVVIDEAEMFAPQKRQNDPEALEITNQYARRGRSFGLNLIFITQRPSDLEKDVLSQCNLRIVGYLQLERDFDAVRSELNIGQQADSGRGRSNGAYVPPGMGPRPVQVKERIEHRNLLSLKTGEFYAVFGGKVWKLPPCRKRRTPDLAKTPKIVVRQRPLFEMDNASYPGGDTEKQTVVRVAGGLGAAYEEIDAQEE